MIITKNELKLHEQKIFGGRLGTFSAGTAASSVSGYGAGVKAGASHSFSRGINTGSGAAKLIG